MPPSVSPSPVVSVLVVLVSSFESLESESDGGSNGGTVSVLVSVPVLSDPPVPLAIAIPTTTSSTRTTPATIRLLIIVSREVLRAIYPSPSRLNGYMRLADKVDNGAEKPAIVGIVNVTPDSFSDGGLFLDADAATAKAIELVEEGADAVDVGGESTRPGAEPVSAQTEIQRTVPVIERAASAVDVPISIDTYRLEVAEAAVRVGASMVNDISAFRMSPDLAGLCAEHDLDVCLVHMQGEPRTMQDDPKYEDVIDNVKSFLSERMNFAVSQGIDERRVMLDPGIGFGKTLEHNIEILERLEELAELGRPILIGTSRKSFLGSITGREVGDRVAATVASNVIAYLRGASVFRVHDVAANRDALAVARAILTVGIDS